MAPIITIATNLKRLTASRCIPVPPVMTRSSFCPRHLPQRPDNNNHGYNLFNDLYHCLENPGDYSFNMVTSAGLEVRVVVFTLQNNMLQVLLQTGPVPEKWELPGCRWREGVGLETSASQCVENLTGLKEVYLEQLYTFGDPGRHPGGLHVTVVYFALLAMDTLSDERIQNSQSTWQPVRLLPDLAWDHADILTYALRRLRYKLEYSAVGFELLPETFSLSELQHTYELILGETLDKRNFRRRILEAGIIEPTSERRTGEGRPAQLYRYRADAVAEVKARRLFP
jgi:8-oxo-dGTP diphosphatase